MAAFLLFAAATSSAIASVLLKLAARLDINATAAGMSGLWALMTASTGVRLGAVIAYGVGFVFYAMALKRVALSTAYPVMVGITIVALLVYGAMAGESITMKGIAGSALVVVGVALIYL
ncbi:small multidrug resistance pump [Paraburkholderia rhizosphaerae]|uniref:Small multidrug resistance pump n=2 Tax=Paraburkholderia rhizosphaerae TaxID=480658 RepID=A0A4R8LHR4_9BURK|nr:small multidrug resistance pump [Paraburkholderia rhizosphaerae]